MERQSRAAAQGATRQTSRKKQTTKSSVPKEKGSKKQTTLAYILRTLAIIGIVLVLMALLFALGLMIGFGVIGGGNPMGIFSSDVWEHLHLFLR